MESKGAEVSRTGDGRKVKEVHMTLWNPNRQQVLADEAEALAQERYGAERDRLPEDILREIEERADADMLEAEGQADIDADAVSRYEAQLTQAEEDAWRSQGGPDQ